MDSDLSDVPIEMSTQTEIKTPKFGYMMTSVSILLFVIGCLLGIYINKDCSEAKSNKLYNNLRELLNYGLASGIVSFIMILIMKFAKGNTNAIGLVYSILGVITTAVSIGMFYKCKNSLPKKTRDNIGRGVWGVLFLLIITGGISAMALKK